MTPGRTIAGSSSHVELLREVPVIVLAVGSIRRTILYTLRGFKGCRIIYVYNDSVWDRNKKFSIEWQI